MLGLLGGYDVGRDVGLRAVLLALTVAQVEALRRIGFFFVR